MIPVSNSVGRVKREKRLDAVDQRDRFGAMRLVRRCKVLRRKAARDKDGYEQTTEETTGGSWF